MLLHQIGIMLEQAGGGGPSDMRLFLAGIRSVGLNRQMFWGGESGLGGLNSDFRSLALGLLESLEPQWPDVVL